LKNNEPLIPLVDLKAQYQSLKAAIDAAIAEVISQAAFVGNLSNSYVRRFEQQFADWVGVRHAIGCANGTDSLEILLKAFGVGPGDEVIVPAVSWIATSEAVSNIGAVPVFADIDAYSYTLCPHAARAAITPRTKAIIPVHLYGCPADMDGIMALADEFNLFVIEDCAQAHGARHKSRAVGTIGHAGSFSFFPGKNLGAYGDAGGMTTNNDRIAEVARMIGQHGQSAGKHDHRIEGRNSRLDGIQAAVLSAKLEHLTEWTKQRQKHAALYTKLLSDLELPLQSRDRHVEHVYHLYVIQVKNRADFIDAMRSQGISTAIQYPQPLPLLPAYARKGHTPEQFPNACRLAQHCVSLPMYPELTVDLIERVVSGVRNAVSSAT